MKKQIGCFLLSGFFLLTLPAFSQTKKDSLSIEQALSKYSVGNLLFSPDGKKAVVVVSQTGLDERLPDAHIWMIDVTAGTIRQFTSSLKSENNPRWSPDGRQLAFLSARNGKTQIYGIGMEGGEALPLTQSATAISSFEWSPDGTKIAYLTEDAPTEAEKKKEADKYDERVVSESQKPTRLYLLDMITKETRLVTRQNWEIATLKWFPSGDELLLVVQELPAPEMANHQLLKISLKDSSIVSLRAPAHSFWGNITLSPDGRFFVFAAARGDGPTAHDLFIQSTDTGAAKNITAANLDRPVGACKFIGNEEIVTTVHKGFMTRLCKLDNKGQVTAYGPDENVGSFDVAANGDLLFETFNGDKLPEVWLKQAGKSPVQLSHFNKAFDKFQLASAQYITYKSFDGLPIEAALYKPAGIDAPAGSAKAGSFTATGTDGKAGKGLPLVVFIHGGPTGAFQDSYNPWVQLFVQKGYAVFCPNIRGSTGYGWKFVIANRNDWGGADFKDIMAGVDWLIAKEGIDPDRMGISGWSYGGYMSEWAITQTDRFKAAMAGAGLADLASEFGTENGAAYDHWFFGNPYENPERFYKHSPIAFMQHAKTPTLIIQGENDPVDPVGQSQELYRGLRMYNVPAELVIYPREPHSFREIRHTIDFYRRMLNWFDKYVRRYVK